MDKSLILKEVIKIARKAGEYIKNEGIRFDKSKIESKGLNDLVSYVDKETEKMIVEGLKELLPIAGFITEEGTTKTRAPEFNWVIDPLDGTTNFLHGLPIFAVSIGLIQYEKAILGVIYDPNRDECFYAMEGGLAYCNEKEISVNPIHHLGDSLLATGFPYTKFEKMDAYLKVIHEFMPKSHGLRRMGSAAIDLAYVAAGRVEGFFEYNLHPWDVAAGVIIVKQAGGLITDFKGGDDFIFGKEIIAAGPIHAEMLEVIKGNFYGN